MTDDPNLPDNSGEDASSPPPWGEEFDAQRAWNTINHLREFEAPAKQFQRIEEDEEAFREYLAQRGFQVADDDNDDEYLDEEDDDEYDDDEESAPQIDPARIERLEQADAERRIESQVQDFQDHLAELAGDQELSKEEAEWIFYRSLNNGFNPRSTEEAFKAHQEFIERLKRETIEGYRTSKKAPHISSVGQSATQAPNLDNDRERQEWMQERAAQLDRD